MNGKHVERPSYWVKAKITHMMADSRRENWEIALEPFRSEIKSVLEIGSYEGQSALFWCHFFGATVTCIDAWQQVAKGCRSAAEVEQHFDANIHGLPIVKLKQNSAKALAQLNESFDLVYIDGDHSRLQVMIDTCLAWRLLRSRGIMIWDDYTEYRPDLIDRPAPAIDAFLYMMKNEVRVLRDTGQQLIVQKLLGD